MDYLSIRKDDKILIIAPHPDDECIGVGGLMLKYPHQCSIWVLIDGCIGQGNQEAEKTKATRHREFADEMESLGINDYCFLDIPDGTLTAHTDCLEDRDISCFTKIFVTSESDGHPDHTAAFISMINAIKTQNVSAQIYEYEVHTHMSFPTHMLDISELMDRKKSLIRFHESQLSAFPYDEFAVLTAKYRAMQNRQKDGYYEVYRLLQNMEGSLSNDCYETELKLQKQIRFYQLLTKWMNKRNKGRTISGFFEKEEVHSVAVYGYAELGRLTADELMMSENITVDYVIDKKEFPDSSRVKVLKPSMSNPQVGAVIVTAINSFEEIRKELTSLGYTRIISLDEVIDKI